MSLSATGLEVRYGAQIAVQPLSLRLEAGELVGLIGPNGAGKTSLLRALAGIPSPDARVHWQDRPLAALSSVERARAIAWLPQAAQASWPLPVRELVALGRLPHRRFGERPSPADEAAVARALELADLREFADRPIDTLSGGERTRAHLARAFAVEAPVLLVDEPTASLDPFHQLAVLGLLDEYRRQGRLVVAVLHDLNLALAHCTRLLLMDQGAIVRDGEPGSVIDATALSDHYRVSAFLAEHEGRRIAVPRQMLGRDG
jgi:iron complex transport system ATP-binding protein